MSGRDLADLAGRMGERGPGLARLVVVAVVGAIVGIVLLVGIFGAMTRTSGGEVAVVRNGGAFDNHKVRQVIQPASSLKWTGFWSDIHKYPAQQRFYTITAAGGGDRPGVDVIRTPTSDGVNVGLEGTLYFSLTTSPAALKVFDTKFGTRKFRGLDGVQRNAYDGDDGWSGFLDQVLRPVIDNDLREQINSFRCSELVSSCSLVQNATAGSTTQRKVDPGAGRTNNGNIAKVQTAINSSLATDLNRTLGGNFFTGLRFNLVRVTLPAKVQQAVDDAQAAFAKVSEAQARVASARADAEANRIRQRGYRDCPACSRIDELKAIPPSVRTFAPGQGFSVTPGQ